MSYALVLCHVVSLWPLCSWCLKKCIQRIPMKNLQGNQGPQLDAGEFRQLDARRLLITLAHWLPSIHLGMFEIPCCPQVVKSWCGRLSHYWQRYPKIMIGICDFVIIFILFIRSFYTCSLRFTISLNWKIQTKPLNCMALMKPARLEHSRASRNLPRCWGPASTDSGCDTPHFTPPSADDFLVGKLTHGLLGTPTNF